MVVGDVAETREKLELFARLVRLAVTSDDVSHMTTVVLVVEQLYGRRSWPRSGVPFHELTGLRDCLRPLGSFPLLRDLIVAFRQGVRDSSEISGGSRRLPEGNCRSFGLGVVQLVQEGCVVVGGMGVDCERVEAG